MQWPLAERWIGIISAAFTLVAFLLVFSPFRRYVNRFNDWYDARDKEHTSRRLAYVRQQLQDIVDGTSHLHFQKSISGGLLALAVGLTLVFLMFIAGRRGDTGSEIVLVFIAFGARSGSLARRIAG
jgi:hypothetical protein